jgi:hypothetical protein
MFAHRQIKQFEQARRLTRRGSFPMRLRVLLASCLFAVPAFSADPALTIYNQQFAVVRETIPLDLKQA